MYALVLPCGLLNKLVELERVPDPVQRPWPEEKLEVDKRYTLAQVSEPPGKAQDLLFDQHYFFSKLR